MKLFRLEVIVIIIVLSFYGIDGYSLPTKNSNAKKSGIAQVYVSPALFLKVNNIKVKGNPDKFNVVVPKRWDVNLGEYPIGLYWRLANVYSMDAGLDLVQLKGTRVEVWRYSLKDGLPGQGLQSAYKYPSNIVLLVKSNKVVGTWLQFNSFNVGPSIKKRYLKDITGLTYEDWVQKEGLFSNPGKNKDFANFDPVKLLKTYFKAISDGDKTRAYACLDPNELLNSLTMNIGQHCLYNPKFNKYNSIVENIIKAVPISFDLMDPVKLTTIKKVGNQKEIEIKVTLNITWCKNEFTGPETNGKNTRFTILKKYKNGWKLQGLGTGP